jgi:hypothetical protein
MFTAMTCADVFAARPQSKRGGRTISHQRDSARTPSRIPSGQRCFIHHTACSAAMQFRQKCCHTISVEARRSVVDGISPKTVR